MKFGQSIAMLLFTSLAIIGTTQQDTSNNDITASTLGMTIVGIVAVAFCVIGAVVMLFYNEKKVMKKIAKDEAGVTNGTNESEAVVTEAAESEATASETNE